MNSTSAQQPKAWLLITAVALVSMMAPFSIDTYLPSFPAIEASFAISRAQMTQSLAIYLGFFAVATLVWGPMADRWGRKKIILYSLLGYLLASLLCALAENYELFMTGRALQGTMAAGSLVASRAMIRDAFDSQQAQQAMALVMMLFALAPAIAPVIGGWLEVHSGWRSVFFFLACYALIIVTLFSLKIAETQNPEHIQSIHPRHLANSYWQSIRHPLFLRLVCAQSLVLGGFFVYIAGSTSIIFDHLQLKEQDFWLFFIPLVGGIMLGSLASHRLNHLMSAKTTINSALGLALLSVLANIWLESNVATHALLVITPLVFYSFAFALLNPVLSIVSLDCLPSKRGLASSVQSLFQMGTAGLVAGLVVPFVHHSLQTMALAQALLLGSAIILWLSVQRPLMKRHSNKSI